MPTTPQDHKPKARRAQRRTTTAAPGTAQPIPQPAPADDKYAPNTWLAGGVGSLEDVTVPSGQLCLLRRPGLEGLIKAGVLHNVDSLTAIVEEKHIKRVKGRPGGEIDAASLLNDPKALEDVTHVIDKIVCHVVVKPEIHRTPDDRTRRVPGVIYADMVELTDKMFIFNYAVGGTRDLEQFRGQLDAALGGLESGDDVPLPAE